ncbi:MAG: hypothetical protein OHK0046_37460 [Anaerolineae bacterium]
MLERRSKVTATLIMWVALAFFMLGVVGGATDFEEEWIMIPLTMIPLTFGIFVTLAFWAPIVFPWVDAERLRASGEHEPEATPAVKRKRDQNTSAPNNQQLEVLLSLMTPDERERFKQELKRRVLEGASVSEDGEIDYGGVSLSDLLDDDTASRQARR